MQEGLLWRDGRPGELPEKVAEAAAAHTEKYDRRANCCHVHPTMLAEADGIDTVGKVTLVGDAHVLPGELWIGIAEEEECPDRACPGSD